MRPPVRWMALAVVIGAIGAVQAKPGATVRSMTFPLIGKCQWSDTFGAPRGGGTRKHEGQDLMAPKMTPVVACFDGVVTLRRNHPNAGNWITLRGDDGWTANYIHLNNDTPGTDDGQGGDENAFAPGLETGHRVIAGQFLGWVGDSGNAEGTGSHLHFELTSPEGLLNPAASLRVAGKIAAPRYEPPAPDLRPGKGDIRLDAVVRAVDTEKNVLAVSPVAWINPEGKSTVQTVPGRKWPVLKPDAVLRRTDSPETALQLHEIQPGDRVMLLGYETGKYKPLTAYRVLVQPAPAPLLVASSPVRSRPTEGTVTETSVETTLPQPAESAPSPPVPSVPVPSPVKTSKTSEKQTGKVAEMAQRFLDRINYARKEAGLSLLTQSDLLGEVAQKHSTAMATGDFFEHRDRYGKMVGQRVDAVGYPATQLGECIAGTFDTPEKVMFFWMSSAPQYRRLLMDPAFTEIGIGYYHLPNDPGSVRQRHYWTVVLGRR
ncbi:MAG: hypothetical protein OHK0029_37190 [Armatimonadaceae bacterium]